MASSPGPELPQLYIAAAEECLQCEGAGFSGGSKCAACDGEGKVKKYIPFLELVKLIDECFRNSEELG